MLQHLELMEVPRKNWKNNIIPKYLLHVSTLPCMYVCVCVVWVSNLSLCVCVCVCVCIDGRVSALAAVVPSACHYNVDRTVAQVNYHGNRLITPIKHYWAYWGHCVLSSHTHTHTHAQCVAAGIYDERHQRDRKKALYQEAPIRMNGNGDEWMGRLWAEEGLCVASDRNRKWTGSIWQLEAGFRADRRFGGRPTVDWQG